MKFAACVIAAVSLVVLSRLVKGTQSIQSQCTWRSETTDGIWGDEASTTARCGLNAWYLSALPEPTTATGRWLAGYAFRTGTNCSDYNTSRADCESGEVYCRWDESAGCTSELQTAETLEDAVSCLGSDVYKLLRCDDRINYGEVEGCDSNPYCEVVVDPASGASSCRGKGMAHLNETELLTKISNLDTGLFTTGGVTCPAFAAFKTARSTCGYTTLSECLASPFCDWTPTLNSNDTAALFLDALSPPCSVTGDSWIAILAGRDAFGRAVRSASLACSQLPTEGACNSSARFAPNPDALAKFQNEQMSKPPTHECTVGAGQLLGPQGLTNYTSAYGLAFSNDDVSYPLLHENSTQPAFDFTYLGTTYKFSDMYWSSNTYLTFGAPAYAYGSLNVYSPAMPTWFLGAGDTSVMAVYAGVQLIGSETVVRVRYEGHKSYIGGVRSQPTVVYELTFHEGQRVDIVIGQHGNAATGTWGMTDGNGTLVSALTGCEHCSFTLCSDTEGRNWNVITSNSTTPAPTPECSASPGELLGAPGLTNYTSTYGLDGVNGNDDVSHPLLHENSTQPEFDFTYLGTHYKFSDMYWSSNTYLTFGAPAYAYEPLNVYNPAIPTWFLGAGDTSVMAVYAGVQLIGSETVVRVRYEGHTSYIGAVHGQPTVVYELTFHEGQRVDIVIGQHGNAATGVWGMTDGNGTLVYALTACTHCSFTLCGDVEGRNWNVLTSNRTTPASPPLLPSPLAPPLPRPAPLSPDYDDNHSSSPPPPLFEDYGDAHAEPPMQPFGYPPVPPPMEDSINSPPMVEDYGADSINSPPMMEDDGEPTSVPPSPL